VVELSYDEITGWVQNKRFPDPNSVRLTLDLIGRVNLQAKEVQANDFSDLWLFADIPKSGLIDKLYRPWSNAKFLGLDGRMTTPALADSRFTSAVPCGTALMS